MTGPTCPECGRAIELHLVGTRRYWVPPIFMFLAFGWMLIAGGMNTYRNARYAWDAAHTPTGVFYSISMGGPPLSATGTGPITITTGPGAQLQITQSAPPAAASWSLVSPDIWIRLGWSVFLLLAAGAGLAVLWRHLSTPLSARAWARARLLAIAAFTIYAGFHLYWFAVEMF